MAKGPTERNERIESSNQTYDTHFFVLMRHHSITKKITLLQQWRWCRNWKRRKESESTTQGSCQKICEYMSSSCFCLPHSDDSFNNPWSPQPGDVKILQPMAKELVGFLWLTRTPCVHDTVFLEIPFKLVIFVLFRFNPGRPRIDFTLWTQT